MVCRNPSYWNKLQQNPGLLKERTLLLTNKLNALVVAHDCDCNLQGTMFNPSPLQALLERIYKSSGRHLKSLVLPVSFIKHGLIPNHSEVNLENFGL